jgi:hypothetical protein
VYSTIGLGIAVLVLAVAVSADEVDTNGNKIVEGTRSLEKQYRCIAGDFVSCLAQADFDCRIETTVPNSYLCSQKGRPTFRVSKSDKDGSWQVTFVKDAPGGVTDSRESNQS